MAPEQRCASCSAALWLSSSACPLCGATRLPDEHQPARPAAAPLPAEGDETTVGQALALLEEGDPGGAVLALSEAAQSGRAGSSALATLGLALSEFGMPAEAERTLYGALRAYPSDAEIRLATALFSRSRGHRTEARDHLVIALALDPANEAASAELATLRAEFADAAEACAALLEVSRRESFRGDLAGATETLLRARELNPEHPGVLRALSTVLEQSDRLPDALVAAHRWVEAEPEEPQARAALARLDARLGVREGSARQARRLLARAGSPEAPTQALAILSQALALEPRDPELHVLRGIALDVTGDRAGALAAYRIAARLDPAGTEARERLAAILQAGEAEERVSREAPTIERAERMKRTRMLWRRRAAQAPPPSPDLL